MKLTESRLRRIIRHAIHERMSMGYETSPELELIRTSFGDPAYSPEDVRFLTYSLNLGRSESIEIQDNVIHAGHPPVVIDNAQARAAGTSTTALLDMLDALGARHVR